ncbi:MAG: alpha/beta hydrolase-fold protein [Desulfovibrionales bacterium]
MKQQPHRYALPENPKVYLNYLLYLPEDYKEDTGKSRPCILFLHGAGERGDDVSILTRTGLPEHVEKQQDFPFITVSPQCPDGSGWHLHVEVLHLLLGDIMEKYRIDPDRLYLTGISMGGAGAWHFGSQYPERFAALAPICGYGQEHLGFPERVCALKNVPVWAFHGAKDSVVPPVHSQVLVDTLGDCGGNVKFTLYPDLAHDSWTATYSNPELYTWFLMHTRQETAIPSGS